MLAELDTVVLTRNIPEHGLKAGDVGTVVLRYKDGDEYEVEFVSGEGKTLAVVTLPSKSLRALEGKEILHVRPLISA